MDLWTPQVEASRFHPNFKAITGQDAFAPERATIDEWASGFVDRDGKFVTEFQTTFDPCFWELYLFACFKTLRLRADFFYARPDFVLSGSTGCFSAEATIASHPVGYAPEWDKDFGDLPVDIERLLVLASTRISNAFVGKLRKFRNEYAHLPHIKGKPFVLCIGPFEQPYSFLQNDHALRRVLYAFDQPLWIEDPDSGERMVVGFSNTWSVHKSSGAEVDFGYFTDPRAKEISAVLFSSTATFGKVRALARSDSLVLFNALRYNASGTQPHLIRAWKQKYSESLLDGLHLCLNPFAEFPFDPSLFENREVAIHRYDPEYREYGVRSPEGFLLQRTTMGFNLVDKIESKPRESGKPYPHYVTPDLAPWEEGVLVPVEAVVGIFADNHMAHYRGWTIVIARDQVDGDWGAQATPGKYRTLQQYISAPKEEYIDTDKWYESSERALQAIKDKIDAIKDPGAD